MSTLENPSPNRVQSAAAAAPHEEHASAPPPRPKWQRYATPILVALIGAGLHNTITRNRKAWEGGHNEQMTDDAYVRGDLSPLSTQVAGIVREV